MNRQWMYGDRHTSEYIKGVHDFLEVAEENKQNGFYVLSMPYMWEYEVLLWPENPSHPPALQGFHATL